MRLNRGRARRGRERESKQFTQATNKKKKELVKGYGRDTERDSERQGWSG